MSRISEKKAKDQCSICLSEDLLQARETRNTKKDNWIRCDCCKLWFHARCGDYTQAQYSKVQKENIWLKCVICCLQQVHNHTTVADSALQHDLISVAVAKRLSVGDINKLKQHSSDSGVLNTSSGKNDTFLGLQKEDKATNLESSGIIVEATSVIKSDERKLTADITVNSVDDKIIIIDNISNPGEFATSRRILKEVNLYCPSVKVDFAYSLAKGGVAIHASDRSGRDTLLKDLPEESFGGGKRHTPKGSNTDTVFLKGVDTGVDHQQLKQCLQSRGIDICEVRRLLNRYTGKPIQVVKVRCSRDSARDLVSAKIVINNKVCVVERQRQVRVIRCFNCQCLGHVARVCTNARRCEFCAGTHLQQEKCTGSTSCANCGGSHRASSSKCRAYINRYEDLTKQYTECEYITPSASTNTA